MRTSKNLLQGCLLILTLVISACSHHGVHKPTHVGKKGGSTNEQQSDDGDGPPELDIDVTHIPNATPKVEPLSRFGNPTKYEVFGKNYRTMPHSRGYAAEGTASWYGRKFHGQRTSSGEPYDMYGMTAAHRSLPLPTYAKIENLHNGKEVIVKINDRGPFVKDRLIDLSYAAAKKLGIHASGTGKVRITAIDPVAWHKQQKEHTRLAHAGKKKVNKAKSTTKATQVALADKPLDPTKKPLAQTTTKASKTTQVAKAVTKAPAKTTKATQVAKAASPTPAKTSIATQVAKTDKQIYIQLGAFSKKANAQQLADKASTLTQALSNVDAHVLSSKLANKDSYKVRVGPLKSEQEAQNLQKKLIALNGKTQPKVVYE
jgi:rare lipoprotein A